jgi:hypothetical protein
VVGAARRVIERLIELTLDREGKAEEAVGQFVLAAKVTHMLLLPLSEREGALKRRRPSRCWKRQDDEPKKDGAIHF